MTTLHTYYAAMSSYFNKLLITISSTSPSLGSIALLLIILFLSLKILGILYRAVMWWLTMAVRVAFIVGVAVLAGWVYTRGPDGAWDDLQYWAAYWMREYRKYERQAKFAADSAGWRN